MAGNAYGLETMLIEFDEPGHKRASFMCDGRQYVIDWVAWCFDHGQSEVQVYEGDVSGEPKSWHDLMTVVGADPDLRKWAREFVRTVVG